MQVILLDKVLNLGNLGEVVRGHASDSGRIKTIS